MPKINDVVRSAPSGFRNYPHAGIMCPNSASNFSNLTNKKNHENLKRYEKYSLI
jgi:hypothetical protein